MRHVAVLAGILLAAAVAGCAGQDRPRPQRPPLPAAGPVFADAGIEVFSLHLSAAGRVVDFRYRVLDERKAAALLGRQVEPYAIDQASGARLSVPRAGKVGALRQSSARAQVGRVYFVLFGNTGGVVRPGSLVTVVIGDRKFPNLLVE